MTSEDRTNNGEGRVGLDRSDESQSFVDQSKIDFDPDVGVYSGTAVDGTSEIPGPHQDSETGDVDVDPAAEPEQNPEGS